MDTNPSAARNNKTQLDETARTQLQILWTSGFDARHRHLYDELHRRILPSLPVGYVATGNDALHATIRKMVQEARQARPGVDLSSPDYVSAYGVVVGIEDERFHDVEPKEKESELNRRLRQAGQQIGQGGRSQKPIRSSARARDRLVEALPTILEDFDRFVADRGLVAQAVRDFHVWQSTSSIADSERSSAEASAANTTIDEVRPPDRDDPKSFPKKSPIKRKRDFTPYIHTRERGYDLQQLFHHGWKYALLGLTSALLPSCETSLLPDPYYPEAQVAELLFIVMGFALSFGCLLLIFETQLWRNDHPFISWLTSTFAILAVSVALLNEIPAPPHALYYGKPVDITNLDNQTINMVYPNPFNTDSACPTLHSVASSPFSPMTSCRISGGILHATVISPSGKETGIFETGDPSLDMSRSASTKSIFYVETKFRATDGGPLAECGIYIEGTNTSGSTVPYLFDIKAVSSVHFSTLSFGVPPLPSPFAFPSLNRASPTIVEPSSPQSEAPQEELQAITEPGWTLPPPDANNDSWVTLGILLDGDHYTYLIDGFVSLFNEQLELSKIDSTGPEVTAGISTNGGSASCDFDYFNIRQLPDGYLLP